ncbi:hypothetical protein DV738_g4935, partial [Chaetothyriales sp. CBS 135597]
MKTAILLPLYLAARGVLAQEVTTVSNMGPVALMWPPDRQWGAAQDNIAPCGSVDGVTFRTEFPLDELYSAVALVTADESWHVQIAISLLQNPTSNDDFEVLTEDTRIQEIDMGHMCYPITVPDEAASGTNATIQIKYTSDFDDGANNTFYACSDITYISYNELSERIPCFNATTESEEVAENAHNDPATTASTATASATGTSSTDSSSTASSTASSSETTTDESEGSGKSGMSGGTIAGIVVGVVGGLGIVLGAFFVLWRRGQRYKRSADAKHSPRKVDWEESGAESPNLNKNGTPSVDMTSRLVQTSFDHGLATLAQSVLAGSRHSPLDSLKIGLCVSGGPDSMALSCQVALLRDRDLGFNIDPVAFVIDHNARQEAGTEARTVTRWLSKLGIPSHIARIQWNHPNPLQVSGFEGKARDHRYRLLTKLALDNGVKHLFLGHHRDDQLETVMLKMIRSRSVSFMDLRGMESAAPVPVPYHVYGARHDNPPVPMASLLQHLPSEVIDGGGRIRGYAPGGIFVHRPFLDRTKAELVAVCEHYKVEFVKDKTNEDPEFTIRNAVRVMRTHQLPRALQPDAVLQLINTSRQLFGSLQADIAGYMSRVSIISLNFMSGMAYIRLPRSFIQLVNDRRSVAAGVLSQLCQLVSPNPMESAPTMVESDRLTEFVGHLQSPFWNNASGVKAPVFVNSRALFEGFVPHEQTADSSDYYCWKLSRQPLRPAEIEPVNVVIDPASTSDQAYYSQRLLWDNRFWIQITCSDAQTSEHLTLRPFQAEDWQYLTEQLPRRVVKTLRAVMSDHAPGNSRFTLPALCFRGKVVALPTLTDDLLTTEPLVTWLDERSDAAPFRLRWNVEYKVLPSSIVSGA